MLSLHWKKSLKTSAIKEKVISEGKVFLPVLKKRQINKDDAVLILVTFYRCLFLLKNQQVFQSPYQISFQMLQVHLT